MAAIAVLLTDPAFLGKGEALLGEQVPGSASWVVHVFGTVASLLTVLPHVRVADTMKTLRALRSNLGGVSEECGLVFRAIGDGLGVRPWSLWADEYLTQVLKEKEFELKRGEIVESLEKRMSSPLADVVAVRQLAGQKLREWKPLVRAGWLTPLAEAVVQHDIAFGRIVSAAQEESSSETIVAAASMIKDLITLLADGLVDSSAEQETRQLHALLTTLAQAVEADVVVEDYIARLRSLMERVDQQTSWDDAVAIFLTEAPCWADPPVMVTNATLAAVAGLLELVVSMVPSGGANNSEAGGSDTNVELGEGVAVGVGRCLPECGSQAMMLVMGLCLRVPDRTWRV